MLRYHDNNEIRLRTALPGIQTASVVKDLEHK